MSPLGHIAYAVNVVDKCVIEPIVDWWVTRWDFDSTGWTIVPMAIVGLVTWLYHLLTWPLRDPDLEHHYPFQKQEREVTGK